MKIVIDMNAEIYNEIKNKGQGKWYCREMDNAIRQGTPLPKGHGKLIDSNVLWDAFQDLGQDFYGAFGFAEANAIIEADKDGE